MTNVFGWLLLKFGSPKVIAWHYRWVLPVALCVRYAFTTLSGSLLVAIGFYFAMKWWGSTKPLTPSQLILWLDSLPADAKTAVFTSIITISGFLIAFRAAGLNWQKQTVIERRMAAVEDIDRFFSELSRNALRMQIYVESLVEITESFRQQRCSSSTCFAIRRADAQRGDFEQMRARLSELSIDSHVLVGRHLPLLGTTWHTSTMLERCQDALQKVSTAMWISVPAFEERRTDPFGSFVDLLDEEACRNFVSTCEQNLMVMNAALGGIRGQVMAPLVGANFPMWALILGKRSRLVDAIMSLRKPRS